jgi:hypothetical protein
MQWIAAESVRYVAARCYDTCDREASTGAVALAIRRCLVDQALRTRKKIKPQWDALTYRLLNPPFWGTSEPFKVPQNGGFRGLFGALFNCRSLTLSLSQLLISK